MQLRPGLRAATIGVATAALTLAGALSAAAPSASAQQRAPHGVTLNSFEARLLVDMNRVRANHQLAALTVVPGATDVARQWSWQLARVQTLSHNPHLVRQLERGGSAKWTEIEENVGYGPVTSPDQLFTAYMNSPPHRANILGKDVRDVGVGVVERGSYAWNTVDFVDEYSPSYGATRIPADGISTDVVTPHTTMVLARGAHHDERFGATHTSGVAASRVHFSGGATHTRFSGNSSRGHGAVLFRDSISLRHATALSFQLGASTPTGAPVRVAIKIGNGWRMQTLRTVHVAEARTITIDLPPSARKLLNTIEFSVSGRSLASASHRVTLSVADLTAVAR